jgi:hypothetical protein
MEYTSQLLSNFKLFSKPDEKTILPYSIPKQYVIIIFVVIIGGLVVYYLQDDIMRVLNTWILATHITSQGEWASTYVPTNFSPTSVFDSWST